MAYSRWVPGSYWYVYWSTESGDTKETQIVSVNCTSNYTYVDIKNKFNDIESIQTSFECSLKAAKALKECFDKFIVDVDKKYGP